MPSYEIKLPKKKESLSARQRNHLLHLSKNRNSSKRKEDAGNGFQLGISAIPHNSIYKPSPKGWAVFKSLAPRAVRRMTRSGSCDTSSACDSAPLSSQTPPPREGGGGGSPSRDVHLSTALLAPAWTTEPLRPPRAPCCLASATPPGQCGPGVPGRQRRASGSQGLTHTRDVWPALPSKGTFSIYRKVSPEGRRTRPGSYSQGRSRGRSPHARALSFSICLSLAHCFSRKHLTSACPTPGTTAPADGTGRASAGATSQRPRPGEDLPR